MKTLFCASDWGATPGAGAFENALAIQSAIDEASLQGGGTVSIGPGRFDCAPLLLKSGVTLRLEKGTELVASSCWEDYPLRNQESIWRTAAFLYAEHAENIAIEGEGRIDGQGQGALHFPHPEDPLRRRPFLVLLWKCKGVFLRDITLDNPAFFTFLAEKSENIVAERVKIHSMETENGDGLDFDGCRHIIIRDCFFETGDDGISPKTHYPDWPCEDFDISGCHIRSIWAAFRPGTETTADIRNIRIRDCCFEQCNDGIKIQSCGPGILEDMTLERIVMKDVHRPFFITVNPFRMSKYESSIRPETGGIRRILLDSITAVQSEHGKEYQKNCMILSGSPETAIEDIAIRNCHFVLQGDIPEGSLGRVDVPEYLDYTTIYADIFSISGGFPASGMYARHLRGLLLEDCSWISLTDDQRPVLFMSEAEQITLCRNRAVSASEMLVQAVDSTIQLFGCVLNAHPVSFPSSLTQEEEEKYRSMQHCSERTRLQFSDFARQIDRTRALSHGTPLPPDAWCKDGAFWRRTLNLERRDAMLLMKIFGNVEVFLNDRKIGECLLETPYQDVIWWACDLEEHALLGENTLTLKWKDPDARGGMVSLLPFGAFEEKQVGVWNIEIRTP